MAANDTDRMLRCPTTAVKYPNDQAIGFFMQRAGYEQRGCSRLASLGLEFDFYLAHGLKDTDYDATWRLFYPKGF